MSTLTKLAAIQSKLRDYHDGMADECPGDGNCQVLGIMADVKALMDDTAKETPANNTSSDATPEMRSYPLFELMSREHGLTLMESEMDEIENVVMQMRANDDPEFQATDLLPTDPHCLADAIMRAQSNPSARFMPAHRICILCEKILTQDEKGNVCPTCQQ